MEWVSRLAGLRGAAGWVTPGCGAVLLFAGTYGVLGRLFPA